MGDKTYRGCLILATRAKIFDKFAEFLSTVDGTKVYSWITPYDEKSGKDLTKNAYLKVDEFHPNWIELRSNIVGTAKFEVGKIFDSLKRNSILKNYKVELVKEEHDEFTRILKGADEKFSKDDLKTILASINENQSLSMFFGCSELVNFRFNLWLKGSTQEIHFSYSYDEVKDEALEKNKEVALSIIKESIGSIQPSLGYFTNGDYQIDANIEYYADPYYFCIEPCLDEGSSTNHYSFLDEKNSKLEEIKSILSKEKLFEIIEKCSGRTVRVGESIIVIREGAKYAELGASYFYPRYFVRERVRMLGIELPTCLAEAYYYALKPEKFEKEILNLAREPSDNGAVMSQILWGLNKLAEHNPEKILPYFVRFFDNKTKWNWQSAIIYFLSTLIKLNKVDGKKAEELSRASNFEENRDKVTKEVKKIAKELGIE